MVIYNVHFYIMYIFIYVGILPAIFYLPFIFYFFLMPYWGPK